MFLLPFLGLEHYYASENLFVKEEVLIFALYPSLEPPPTVYIQVLSPAIISLQIHNFALQAWTPSA